jgi:hypothetical protein
VSITSALDRIVVGIDTARYGHRVSFLRPDRRTAAPPLTVLENREGYQALEGRLRKLHLQHPTARSPGPRPPGSVSSLRRLGPSLAVVHGANRHAGGCSGHGDVAGGQAAEEPVGLVVEAGGEEDGVGRARQLAEVEQGPVRMDRLL